MSGGRLEPVVEYLRRAAAAGDGTGASDAELLGRYARGRDEAAFELLVWRHARLVQGVCRRILRHEQDAQDAFQATFLALARQARAIGRREAVGGWLYRVAYRAALRARARTAERAAREQPLGQLLPDGGGLDPCAEAAGRELLAVLDEQVSRLPEKYRVVFALRCLSGKSSAEAARELGCPVGTVESRLGRAREKLRAALARRGVAVPAALLAAGLSGEAGAADGAAALVACTSRAATAFAAGKAAAAGVIPARAAALAKGVLQSMFLTKLKCVAGVVLVVGTLGLVGGGITWRGEAAGQTQAAPGDVRPKPGGDQQEEGLDGLQRQVEERARRLGERRKVLQQIEALQREQEELLRKLVPGRRLDVEVQRLRPLGEKARKAMPLALNDEGVVTKVAPEGLLTIDLRREGGVHFGDLLHVFRLEPQPKYLGRVKVLEVNGAAVRARAVGQVGLIRPGDRAARELTAGQAEPETRPDEKNPAPSIGADAGIADRAPGTFAWGKPHNGLRVGLAVEGQGAVGPRLALAVENVGKEDWVVNLGVMLANGKKQYPLALRLTLTDAQGATYTLRRTFPSRSWPVVAGRLDPFVVPLPAGGRYTLRYDLGDFMGEAGTLPPPGRYRAAFEFVGKAVLREQTNVDTPGFALMNYWTGTVRSAEVVLMLPAGPAKRGVGTGPAVPEANVPQKGTGLLATLSVNHETFMEGTTDKLKLMFTLVNDDRKAIDPNVDSSKVIVNGKALPNFRFIHGTGPRAALLPGESLTLSGHGFGQHFERPGVYRVHWEGEGFLSPEILFRVLSEKGR